MISIEYFIYWHNGMFTILLKLIVHTMLAEIFFKKGTLDVIGDEPFNFWLPDL